jgi:hypothetical protein
VTISTTTSGAVIRYTTDGTDPGFQSPIYAGALTVGRTTVVKARAFAADMTWSAVAGGLYLVDTGTVDPPRFSPGGGQYTARQSVTVTSETSGGVIHYRLDGGDPDELDPVVTSGSTVLVDQNAHLTARAYKTGVATSAVAAADYRITGAVALSSNATFALKADGTVSSWGSNSFQALGDPAVANGDVRTRRGPSPGSPMSSPWRRVRTTAWRSRMTAVSGLGVGTLPASSETAQARRRRHRCKCQT